MVSVRDNMNVDALVRIRDALLSESFEIGFNMEYFATYIGNAFYSPDNHYRSCDTAGCIAGWAVFAQMGVAGPVSCWDIRHFVAGKEIDEAAQEYLGLKPNVAEQLFFPSEWFRANGYDMSLEFYTHITPRMAAQAIQCLIDTGSPDWSHIIPVLGDPEHYRSALGYDEATAERLAREWNDSQSV